VPVAAQQSSAAAQARPLRIGIIGAGNMGGPLGVTWAKAGHQVLWASRNPGELMPLVQQAAPRASAGYADAAAFFGDVVVLAVPPNAVPQLGKDIGPLLRGKIVIDMTNPRADRDGEEQTARWLGMGTGLAMQEYLPGARVVKAFNALGAPMLANPAPGGVKIGVPIAGDNAEDRERVAQFYSNVFGWQTQLMGPEFGDYVLATTTESNEAGPLKPGAINGGFFPRSADMPAQHPSVVIAVEDVQASIEKVRQAGGTLMGEPMDIPGTGRMAIAVDPCGGTFGLWQSAGMIVSLM